MLKLLGGWCEGRDLRLDLQGAVARSASVENLPSYITESSSPLANDEVVVELGMASIEGIVGYLFCTTRRLLFVSSDGQKQLTISMEYLISNSQMVKNGIRLDLSSKNFTIRMSEADRKVASRYLKAQKPSSDPVPALKKRSVAKSQVKRPIERANRVEALLEATIDPVAQLIAACETSTMPTAIWDRVELPEMKALAAASDRLLTVIKPATTDEMWDEIDDAERKKVIGRLTEAGNFLESADTTRLRSTASSLVNRFLKSSYEEEPTQEVKVPSKKPPAIEYALDVPTVRRPPAKVSGALPDMYVPVAEPEIATYAVVAAVLALLVGLIPAIGVIAVPVGVAAIALGRVAEQDNKRFANPAMFVGLLGLALGVASGLVLVQSAGVI